MFSFLYCFFTFVLGYVLNIVLSRWSFEIVVYLIIENRTREALNKTS